MATEKPKIRIDVELRAHASLAVGASGFGDLADPVEHQHRRQRQLRIAGSEQLAATAGDEILITETGTPFTHARGLSLGPRARAEASRRRGNTRALLSKAVRVELRLAPRNG